MKKLSLPCALLVALGIAAPGISRCDEARDAAISIGSGYSPSTHGGDTNGAAFFNASFTSSGESRWSLLARARYVRYTDYPDVGRVSFLPVGLGPVLRLSEGRIKPFLYVLPLAVLSKWGAGGMNRVGIGGEMGGGLEALLQRTVSLRLSASWLRTSDAGTLRAYDAPNVPLEGLDVFVMTLEVSFHWQPPTTKRQ